MPKKFILFFMILTAGFIRSNAQVAEISWQPTALQIDGNPNDWTTNLRFYDGNSELKYEFRNDSQNLYFVFKSEEKTLRRQIEQAGMKLKFAVKGEKKVKATIEFEKKEGMMPLGQMDNANMGQGMQAGRNQNSQRLEMKKRFEPKDTAYIKGFLYDQDIATSGNKDPKQLRFAISSGNSEKSAFELSVPLKDLFGENYDLQKIVKYPVKFQIVINGVSQSSSGSGQMGGSGGMSGLGGGMGGPGGGEMGERPSMPEGMGDMQQSMDKKSFKATILLTTQN
ncbi:MAG: hypothetical protein PHH37_06625 [Paludibacter sp.]|nr:hypothetical protein [Paludibacter sp.]